MHVGADELVEPPQDAVDDLDEDVALLVVERRGHQQREDLVEQGPGAELAGLVAQGAQRRLALLRRAVFDLEQQLHDAALLGLLEGQLVLVDLGEQLAEVLRVLGPQLGEPLDRREEVDADGGRSGGGAAGPSHGLLVAHEEALLRSRERGRGRGRELSRRGHDGNVGRRRVADFVAVAVAFFDGARSLKEREWKKRGVREASFLRLCFFVFSPLKKTKGKKKGLTSAQAAESRAHRSSTACCGPRGPAPP